MEEAASRASFALDQPLQSWKELEAQGILLHKASVVEKEAASFGRERYDVDQNVPDCQCGYRCSWGNSSEVPLDLECPILQLL